MNITILNSARASNEFIDNLKLTWPQATNGNLLSIKLDGDTLWTGTQGGGTLGRAASVVPPLVADATKRKINKNSSDVLDVHFQNNVAALNNAAYTGSAHSESGTTRTSAYRRRSPQPH